MKTQLKTTILYIVSCGEIVTECSAPWCVTIYEEFKRELEWYKHQEWRTVMVEASDDEEALTKYHEAIDASDLYFNTL